MKYIRWKTKIKLKGKKELVSADLYGYKGGDLCGGKVLVNNKIYTLGYKEKGLKQLPNKYFPIRRTTKKSPFVDF